MVSTEAPAGLEVATFAGGCFWGLELMFMRQPGVSKTASGFSNGPREKAKWLPHLMYRAAFLGTTGHAEVVQVTFDPQETTFTKLLEAFVRETGVTKLKPHALKGGARGDALRFGVYYHNARQKADAEAFYKRLKEQETARSGGEVAADLEPMRNFYLATEHHQQYLAKRGYT